MTLQWMGAAMVIIGCGGVGFSMAAGYSREMRDLQQLHRLLNEMEWELQYRLTPLPELCRLAAVNSSGIIQVVFNQLREDLTQREHPDVRSTMEAALSARRVPKRLRRHLKSLGASLGRYDLQGQIQGLRSVKAACRRELNELEKGRTERIRGYQTLALCAGAAIAILLI